MRLISSLSIILLSLSLSSEPVEIMYYDFFGDYLAESPYKIDIDIENLSIAQIKEILLSKRENQWPMESDLAIVGYGPKSFPGVFFGAFNNVEDQTLLKHAFPMHPARETGSQWYVYFVNNNCSEVVRNQKDHHWASSRRWLALVGLQDLFYVPYGRSE